MNLIFLRPHHINCIFFFEGKGYDERFTKNMKNVINRIISNKSYIKFTKHCDCLCSKCPNRINNVCNTENHIKMLDELTIKNYNVDFDKIYSFNDLFNEFYKNFDKDKFLNICNSCEWYKEGVCGIDKIGNNINKYKKIYQQLINF